MHLGGSSAQTTGSAVQGNLPHAPATDHFAGAPTQGKLGQGGQEHSNNTSVDGEGATARQLPTGTATMQEEPVNTKSPESDRTSDPSSKDDSERQARSSTGSTSLSPGDSQNDGKTQDGGDAATNNSGADALATNSQESSSESTQVSLQKPRKDGQSKDSRNGISVGGKKRYPCPFPGCDKTFSTSGHSSRHSRIHTGEKPYRCSYPGCNAQFSRYDNSLQHYRTHIISSKGGKKSRGKSGAQTVAEIADANEVDKQARAAITLATPEHPTTSAPIDTRVTRPVPATGVTVRPMTAYPASTMARATSGSTAAAFDTTSSGAYADPSKPVLVVPEEPAAEPVMSAKTVDDDYAPRAYAPMGWNGYKKMRSHTTEATMNTSPSRSDADRLYGSGSSQNGSAFGSSRLHLPYGTPFARPGMTKDSRSWPYLSESVGAPGPLTSRYAQYPHDDDAHRVRMMWPSQNERKRLTSDPGTTYRLPGSRTPFTTTPSFSRSPQRAAQSTSPVDGKPPAPVLSTSQTFDFGRSTAYPLSGPEVERSSSFVINDRSDLAKLASRKMPPRPAADQSYAMHARPSAFRIRKSGSMPSMLALEMPRSESSHSLSKYSLGAGTPSLSTQAPGPVPGNEFMMNRHADQGRTLTEQPSSAWSGGSKGQDDEALILPPLSRLP